MMEMKCCAEVSPLFQVVEMMVLVPASGRQAPVIRAAEKSPSDSAWPAKAVRRREDSRARWLVDHTVPWGLQVLHGRVSRRYGDFA